MSFYKVENGSLIKAPEKSLKVFIANPTEEQYKFFGYTDQIVEDERPEEQEGKYIEEYYEGRLFSKMNRTYDAGGDIIQETVYCSNRFDEMELRSTETYFYDENGFLYSRESKSPIPEMFLKYSKDSRTETTDSWTYKCDAYGNVIEKISYVTDTSCPRYRTEYRISYR